MTRRARTLLTLASLSLGGCSLVWVPVVDPVVPDAGLDAYVEPPPDANEDAPVEPPDAWRMLPPEDCEMVGDEDDDDLADCNDPDCFRSMSCCNPSVGTDLGTSSLGGGLSAEWSSLNLDRTMSGPGVLLRTTGTATVGSLWRNNCVPLGQGGRFEVRVGAMPTPGSGESVSLVLSPAREPSGTGFLDELSIHIDDANRATVTRAGRQVTLDDVACRTPEGAAQLGPETTFVIDLLPGVADGRSALIASAQITSSAGACTSTTTLFDDEVILADDLVRTPEDGSRSCQDSPGLFFAIDVRPGTSAAGGFSIVPLSGVTPSIVLRSLECASPGVFNRSSVVLDRTSVDAIGAAHTAGGIGAPDLVPDATEWALAYDASVEDRSEELFRALTLSLGVSNGPSYDSDTWSPSTMRPIAMTGPRSREPGLTLVGGSSLILLWARETTPASGSYEIARATYNTAGSVTDVSSISPTPAAGSEIRCESLREPTEVFSYSAAGDISGEYIFARCDFEASSTLVLWHRTTAGVVALVDANVLATTAGSDRVIAADVLSSPQSGARFFALWVLMRGTSDEAEVRLFLADRIALGAAPTFVPYAGNPILRADDGSLAACPAGATCRLTSLSVARIPMSGPDRLRFLFARSRTGAIPAYELIAAEQTSLRGLEGP